ncbi:MAG TPA: DUF1223 domain-containing protein [Bryobacteraceae bacterium]|nr:DUF1223 domain-containing protein [Bryobacteraceae bacterium]
MQTSSDPAVAHSRALTLYCVLAAESTESSVKRGENRGRQLTHTSVAYSVTPLGSTKARTAWSNIPLPLKATFPTNTGTRVIVFLQDGANGHILGAAQSRL